MKIIPEILIEICWSSDASARHCAPDHNFFGMWSCLFVSMVVFCRPSSVHLGIDKTIEVEPGFVTEEYIFKHRLVTKTQSAWQERCYITPKISAYKSCSALNSVQKIQWAHMSIFLQSRARGLERLTSLKHCNVQKWENRISLRLDDAKNTLYMRKRFK